MAKETLQLAEMLREKIDDAKGFSKRNRDIRRREVRAAVIAVYDDTEYIDVPLGYRLFSRLRNLLDRR